MAKRGIMLAVTVLAGITLAARPKVMRVQVREAQVRQAPGFLSRILATVPYTEAVTVLEEKADWKRVQAGGIEGWMHDTALTTKRLALSGSGADARTAVTSDEQALAGKGFNSDVEKQFRQQNRDADFSAVDRMESQNVAIEVIRQFLADGGLTSREGGAQ